MEHENLIRLTAVVDAVFQPCRYRHGDADIVRCELMCDYLTRGLPWGGGGTSTERNIRMVALDALEEKGQIIRYRGTGPRSFSCRPTERGYDFARQLCGLPTFEESAVDYLSGLLEYDDHPEASVHNGDTWIPETLLADHEWGGKDTWPFLWEGVAFAPCLIRQLCWANGTMHGQVYYHLSDSGRMLLQSGILAPAFEDKPQDPEPSRLYWDEFWNQHDGHARMKRENRNFIGTIPLPVSMAPKE